MDSKKLKVMLIAPPHFYLFNTLGIPQLTAYLKSQGRDVEQVLVDTDIYSFLLSPDEMDCFFSKIQEEILPRASSDAEFRETLEERLSERDGIRDMLQLFGILKGDEDTLTVLGVLLTAKANIIGLCVDAVAQIESNYVNLGYEDFLKKVALMNFGLQIIGLSHMPAKIDVIEGIELRYSPMVVNEIVQAVTDRNENLLIDYFEKRLYPRLTSSDVGIIGIQINHENQMIPAFTIMDWVRKNLPDTFIIIGGTLVSYLREQIASEPKLWDYLDGIGTGMGEYTLDKLVECLENDLPLAEVPNLTYRNQEGQVIVTQSIQVDMEDVAVPEFPETRPSPILPYTTSVGCYWGKCAFCEYPYHHMCSDKVNEKSMYFIKSERKVVDELKYLKDKYNPFFFFFCDSDITPKRLEKIADMILEEELEVNFFVWTRAELEFRSLELCRKLAKAGLFGVYMGLEAGSQRINDFMNKGIEVESVEKIIRNFHQVGIICSVFSMVGTPTETRDEAMLTKEFIRRNLQFLDGTISISAFQLSAYSGISAAPEKYGIKEVVKPGKGNLALVYDYKVKSGLTQEESIALRDDFRDELGLRYISAKFILEFVRRQYPAPVLTVPYP